MQLDRFLSTADSHRALQVLRKLAEHDISQWALTGGIAIELQILRSGGQSRVRPLHDIDFLVDSFGGIPETLARELLIRHIHPYDPPGKTLLQAVDREIAVRIDVFRGYGREMDRTELLMVAETPWRVVSLPDLVARHARLNWDLIEGKRISRKYAQDFLRMLKIVATEEVEEVWKEHRKPHSPESFSETVRELRRVTELRQDLLVDSDYSTDISEVCPRCQSVAAFPLADAGRIVELLGYC